MKKIASIFVASIVAILGIFSFTGCSLFGPTDENTSLTGVLTEQVSNDGYPGTHLITDDSGGIHAVSSTMIALSSQQYIGNKVTVRGKDDSETGIFMADSVAVDEILEKATGKANWTTYMNQELGFRWKYYDDWGVAENETGVVFMSPLKEGDTISDMSISVTLLENADKKPLDQFVTESVKASGREMSAVVSDAKVGIEQYPAKKVLSKNEDGLTETEYFLARDAFIQSILFYPNKADVSENTFNEMMLEFTFVPMVGSTETTTPIDGGDNDNDVNILNQTDSDADNTVTGTTGSTVTGPATGSTSTGSTVTVSADYSTYADFESGPYFFSGKYPKSWYYSGEKGKEEGVLHIYKFSNEKMEDDTNTKVLAVLNVLSTSALPSGNKISLPNGEAVKQTKLGDEYVFVKVGDRVYSVQGSQEMASVIESIAGSIKEIKNP